MNCKTIFQKKVQTNKQIKLRNSHLMHFNHSSDQFTSRVRILNYISLYSYNLCLIQSRMIGNFQLRGDKYFVHSGEKSKENH